MSPVGFRDAIPRLRETHVATRLDRWLTGVIVVLLFSLGFIAGRWTSLTSSATPIVFQEAPGSASSVASPEELRALVAGAAESRSPSPASAAKPNASPVQQKKTQTTGAFVASVNGTKYYRPDCSEVRRIKEENTLWFDSEEEAKDSGYEPSACVQKVR